MQTFRPVTLARPLTDIKKTLDTTKPFRHTAIMAKHILKVSRAAGNYRIVIPKKVILRKRWADVEYLMLEDYHDEKLVLRRFIDVKGLQD